MLVTRRDALALARLAELGLAVAPLSLETDKVVGLGALAHCDTLVLAFPPGLRRGGGEAYLARIRTLLAALPGTQVQQLLLVSSSGALGHGDGEMDETSPAEAGNPLAQAEQLILESPYRAAVIRMAGLFGPDRHPGRWLAGKTDLKGGGAPVNLVHQHDAVGLCLAIIERQAWGRIYHGVCPVTPPKDQFYPAAARALGLTPPTFADQVGGKKVLGEDTARALDYHYQVPDPLKWLEMA
ncbi:hypothetical protein [Gallaecimonas sp. GXIMD4217]|uniref:hypothetical protein n=1 Tax=Gallaecimonas sp. GXIMD4217 TaxID=3131927 RepID=UPI00311ADE54